MEESVYRSELDDLGSAQVDYDPRKLASRLTGIEERLDDQEYRSEDILFLNEVSEFDDYEGLQDYSEKLLDRYSQDLLSQEVEKFEEYRNPFEYAKSLAHDWDALASNTRYGDTGLEFFSDSSVEEWREEARVNAFRVMSTNIGREVVLNFVKYKPRGPFWDIAGASYGLMRGMRMEIEERDVEERLKEVFDFLDD
ncbi:hypothetical protein [Candidatus Nanohalococcus occultus]|uniref:Uncharacterized protein n=1 Tax=Candidatus Nanohalococcus occultus TaxID=2978047 RepID=A0ABY8CF57_9ARCH|nr:hypothetical protein SVXNc_0821 [Candidatus Nanohaloarchaeota archaeon SVXNc]